MRLSPSPAAGLIATHAALTTGVHGITGTIVGTSEAQTLTNKIIGAGGLTILNVGAGADPVITSDNAGKWLKITGGLEVTGRITTNSDVEIKSGTAFIGTIAHNISAHRTFTFPDVTGNVIIDADTGKSLSLAQITIENAGAGTDPVITCNNASPIATLTGGLLITTAFYIRDSTAYSAKLAHSNTAGRTYTYPDISGTVCMWNAANAAVTRYYSVGGHAIVQAVEDDGTHRWVWDSPNEWAQSAVNGTSWMGINLPHGAIVTAFRVTCQDDDTAGLTITIQKRLHSSGALAPLASIFSTASMAEIADTSITNATVDNNLNSYHLKIIHHTNASECRIQAFQIDYTVTAPQP